MPSSRVQPIAASMGTCATWMPCGMSSRAMLWASPALPWQAHGEGAALRIALERGAGVGEEDRSAQRRSRRALGRACSLPPADRPGRRCTPHCAARRGQPAGSASVIALRKISGAAPVDVVVDELRHAQVGGDVGEEPGDRLGLARVAGVVAHTEVLRQLREDRLVRVARSDGDLHPLAPRTDGRSWR